MLLFFRKMFKAATLLLLTALAASATAERSVYRLSLAALQRAATTRRVGHLQRALEDVGAFAVEGLGARYALDLDNLDAEAPGCLEQLEVNISREKTIHICMYCTYTYTYMYVLYLLVHKNALCIKKTVHIPKVIKTLG